MEAEAGTGAGVMRRGGLEARLPAEITMEAGPGGRGEDVVMEASEADPLSPTGTGTPPVTNIIKFSCNPRRIRNWEKLVFAQNLRFRQVVLLQSQAQKN